MNRSLSSLCLYTLLVLLAVAVLDLSAQSRCRFRHRHRHFYQQVPGDTKINFNDFDGMLKGE